MDETTAQRPEGSEAGSRPMVMAALHRQLGMTDDELDAVIGELGREPTHLELAMYSVMWSEHCSYKSSRPHLGRFPTDRAMGARRARRGRRCHRHRRRSRRCGAHREPQPPLRCRAIRRRRDRGRRHHSRHLLDGRAADRAHGLVAVRHARRRAHALPLRRGRVGHQRLRELGRRSDGRRRSRVRRHVPRQPARERPVPRHPPDRAARARSRRRARQPRGASRLGDGPRRHRRRERARIRRIRGRQRERSDRRCRSAIHSKRSA